ncbi:protein kinase [Streptomyces sp. NPDC006645]|uniref:protein kinase domain-containing protein n=1 Tax=unclassified Streptomyces TaxID=2593676 RepID=UPI0033BD496F
MEKLTAGDPQNIGAYRLLSRLGAGVMGQVYLARSERGRTVAVKLVRKELAEHDEFRGRLRLEVAAARRVGGAWTAPVVDANTEAAVPWIATEYVVGPTLQEVVSGPHGPLPARSVRILGSGLAHALEDIHGAGLIHRDLKPSNVLVSAEGPRAVDFCIARALETVTVAGATAGGGPAGSPGFMAPEQVRGTQVTAACDVFSLGSVLAYAATGRLPFGAADTPVHVLMFRIAQEEPDLSELPEGLRELVADCLKKDPAGRPTPAQILARVGEPDDDGGGDGGGGEPWLPGALFAQLGAATTDVGAPARTAPAFSPQPPSPPPPLSPSSAPQAPPPPSPSPSPQAPPSQEAAEPSSVPPPPGVPGTPGEGLSGGQAMHGMATMIPTPPPPGAPSPRQQPQLPPLPQQYGYPQPGQPPLPPWGATPPYGPPPANYGHPSPYGPTPPPAPAPEPAGRSRRGTIALIAVALVVALGAGGSVYAFMGSGDEKNDSSRSQADGSTDDTSSADDNAPSDEAPSDPESPSPSSSETEDEAGAGEVPKQYLGAWSGTIDGDAGRSTRELAIRQGEVGDTVLVLTAQGPTDTGGTYECVFEAALDAAPGSGPLKIGPSTVTSGRPMSSCTPGAATELTILPDGRLRRATTAGGESVTYTKGG